MTEIWVISAEYLGEYKIKVTFEDQKEGVVDLQALVDRGGVFAKLADPDYFKKFEIDPEWGVITWENRIDIAPETLYSLATGESLPDWMQETEKATAH